MPDQRTKENKAIYRALNHLCRACGFAGESGTEEMLAVLTIAMELVENEWYIVEQSHDDGLSYDVNSMLADAICKVLAVNEIDKDPGPATAEHPLQ